MFIQWHNLAANLGPPQKNNPLEVILGKINPISGLFFGLLLTFLSGLFPLVHRIFELEVLSELSTSFEKKIVFESFLELNYTGSHLNHHFSDPPQFHALYRMQQSKEVS